MALINCPECNKQISDRAEICPHCGLPKIYFNTHKAQESGRDVKASEDKPNTNYKVIRNMLIAFDRDYNAMFNTPAYIASSTARDFYNSYYRYLEILKSPLARQFIQNNAFRFGFDVE